MIDIIVGGILLVILGGAVVYLVKAKKAGVSCIGCPHSGSCSGAKKHPDDSACGCGCQMPLDEIGQ